MKQVLIVNITRMGDLVQMGALLSRLQEEWPGVAVDLVVDRRFAPVASLLKGLREVIAFDFHELIDESRALVKDVVALYQEAAAWVKPLAERRYDRVINLTFNKPSALLAGFIGAPDIRGAQSAWDGGIVIEHPWMAYFSDFHQFRRLNRFNLVDIYALGGSGPGTFAPLRLTVSHEARAWAKQVLAESSSWIAVQAGASDGMKAWRPHLFGQALAQVSKRWQDGILFIGSREEEATIAEVVRVYRAAGGQNLVKTMAGRTTLDQLAGLLGECRLLLTNDTGPMHVGVAVGTSVIDLSVGHVDFQETGPYGPGHWVVQPELDCAPCGFDHVCAHHACKDRITSDFVADLMGHLLNVNPCPSRAFGARLYESGVDEDGLSTFRLKAGTESPVTAWYAAFWRRYWYEAHTGLRSHLPSPEGPPPDVSETKTQLRSLMPLLETACRRADEIARLASRASVNISELKRLQREQGADQERLLRIGMATEALAPLAAAFCRQVRNDNVIGLSQLARHQAGAYQTWRRRLVEIDRSFTPGHTGDLLVVRAERQAA
ncbi:MAG: glycosyltransferase family 9 protein [Nitrospira sp.]|nr:glycosyltransferase family 9 protein [Nitrospira sp.]MDH4302535.1 glycosyltransferase family 9 protein [Nitrospira sp.]MDH5193249.1 glycosyltransferase family 9 protein [Nitrospira sp.]